MVKAVCVASIICQISLCTLGLLGATNNPALAEARLALGEASVRLDRETLSFRTPSFLAQVTADETVNTEVNTNGNTAEITGGETRGDNLFHSFQDFSVETGNEAFFNNANDISNIFSRVTGGNISNIDGLIRSNGSANLFLINPAGILMGENARLDLGGSFYGSTADSILFEDGEFSATDLSTPPMLTINAPIGLQFRETAGEVEVRGTGNNLAFDLTSLSFAPGETPPGLQVKPGETLALVGKGLKLEGGNLFADGGRIEVGSVNSPSLVNLIATAENWSLDYENVASFQDIELSNRASVDVSSTLGAGSIQIQGRNVSLDGGSAVFSFTGSQPGGTIQVNATDTLNVTGVSANNQVTSVLYTAASSDGTAKGGDLAIATDQLIARGGAQIGADTYGKGSAGIITVEARESVLLSGTFPDNDDAPTALGTFVQPGATGSGSQLNLTTQRLTIADGGQLITATIGDGSAATLTANVAFLTEITGTGSAISSSVISSDPIPTGDGGKINLETGQLKISDEALITVSNEGLGDAGDINIISPNIGLSDRAQIIAETESGTGGNIKLQIDDTLTLDNNSVISAQASNRGNGGNVNIDANFIVAFPNQIAGNGSDIIASAEAGNGGSIKISGESLLGIEARKAKDNNRTNDIDASSEFGLNGTVEIFTPDSVPLQATIELPSNVVEAEPTATQVCNYNREAGANQGLAIAGKGGITPAPDGILNSDNIITSNENSAGTSTIPEPIETSQGKIQLARGIMVTKSGEIILTAYPTNNAGERMPEVKPNCNSELGG
ncbi:MAG: filamentous hemagglutinin N-terminal domain-containing protein [Hydrococcus sp. SU_1_0]|nr:filamentous hemagglutinin N-terminal domain-containing protein [Hydrococcus sp. SU_1_0]